MSKARNKTPTKTASLHPRNPHQGRYDFVALCRTCPDLRSHLKTNPRGDDTIDFSDDQAVLCLNKALIAHYYYVESWDIPKGYLCPPIPGRADYIHYLADLLATCADSELPSGKHIKVLDIGTGANLIYPIIGSQSYGWQFVASDIDPVSVKTANSIVQSNACLNGLIRLQQQKNSRSIFKGVIAAEDRFDLTMCNPPFHASMADAQASNQRKIRNLGKGKKTGPAKLNFGGQKAELWCPGGEIRFLKDMAKESLEFGQQVCWFSSLVSKEENVRPLQQCLKKLGALQIEVMKMSQGQKISRLIAWSFLNPMQQQQWMRNHRR
jgi:23S rRNA (adenine1618-N6)-methyltransferase